MKKNLFPLILLLLFIVQCKKDDKGNQYKTLPAIGIVSAVNSIAIDNQDNKWFATDSGLYKFNNTDWTRYELPIIDRKINSLNINNDTMMVSTQSGTFMLKIEKNEILLLDEYNVSTTAIISDSVNVSGFDPYNNIWFGTYLGLSFLNGTQWASNKTINYKLTSRGNNISCFAFRQKDFFFGTIGHSLWHVNYDNETDAVTGASLMIYDFNGKLTTDTIYSLFADNDSSIWIGSNTGLTRNKGTTHVGIGEFEYFLEGHRVNCIIESTGRLLWAGTESGLYVKDGTLWTNYTTAEGLADNFILSLAEDKEGKIWIGTKKGLTVYNGSTWADQSDKLTNKFITAIAFDKDGSAWIGTKKGLVNIK